MRLPFFLLLAGVSLGAATFVVLGRDIIRNGLMLILTLGALAGLYAMLGAAIVAGAQVLVYIGAISVLILFAIMLTQSKAAPARLAGGHGMIGSQGSHYLDGLMAWFGGVSRVSAREKKGCGSGSGSWPVVMVRPRLSVPLASFSIRSSAAGLLSDSS